MEYIQVFYDDLIDSEKCKGLFQQIPIIDQERGDMAQLVMSFHEIDALIRPYVKKYIKTLRNKCNLFEDPDKQEPRYKVHTKVVHIPRYTYQMYSWEPGCMINFHIYIEDCPHSVTEMYNPFSNTFIKYKPQTGLIVMYPAFWGVVNRSTSTLDTPKTYIMGTLDFMHFNDM